MELDQLKLMWQEKNSAVGLNAGLIEKIQTQKVISNLKPFLTSRYVVLALHIFAMVFILFSLFNNQNIPYFVSGIVLFAFYIFLVYHCVQEIILVRAMSSVKTILEAQQSLAKIQSHNLLFLKLSVLFIPVFLTYPIVVPKGLADLNINIWSNFDILEASNGNWWSAQLVAFIILIPLGIWFYLQINAKNLDKFWVKRIIKKSMNASVVKSLEYLNELEKLKN
ncbi:MAG: hypothetical protein V4683_17555 [Bacteroidota bacterium]